MSLIPRHLVTYHLNPHSLGRPFLLSDLDFESPHIFHRDLQNLISRRNETSLLPLSDLLFNVFIPETVQTENNEVANEKRRMMRRRRYQRGGLLWGNEKIYETKETYEIETKLPSIMDETKPADPNTVETIPHPPYSFQVHIKSDQGLNFLIVETEQKEIEKQVEQQGEQKDKKDMENKKDMDDKSNNKVKSFLKFERRYLLPSNADLEGIKAEVKQYEITKQETTNKNSAPQKKYEQHLLIHIPKVKPKKITVTSPQSQLQ